MWILGSFYSAISSMHTSSSLQAEAGGSEAIHPTADADSPVCCEQRDIVEIRKQRIGQTEDTPLVEGSQECGHGAGLLCIPDGLEKQRCDIKTLPASRVFPAGYFLSPNGALPSFSPISSFSLLPHETRGQTEEPSIIDVTAARSLSSYVMFLPRAGLEPVHLQNAVNLYIAASGLKMMIIIIKRHHWKKPNFSCYYKLQIWK